MQVDFFYEKFKFKKKIFKIFYFCDNFLTFLLNYSKTLSLIKN